MPSEILAGTVFNVLDYGAVADYDENTKTGTANDSAFVAARNAAAALTAKGVVLVPAGKYKLMGTLALGGTGDAGLTWQGVSTPGYGQQSAIFYTGSGTALQVTNSGTVLRNLALVADAGGTTGVDLEIMNHCIFDQVAVSRFSSEAFKCRGSYWTRWYDCLIQGAGSSSVGIRSTVYFNGCVVDGCRFVAPEEQSWEAIHLTNNISGAESNGSVIQNCDFGGGGPGSPAKYAIVLGSGCGQISVINNRHESDGLGFLRQAPGAGGLWVSGNQMAGATSIKAGVLVSIEGTDAAIGINTASHATTAISVASGANRVLVHPQYLRLDVTTGVQNASTGSVTVLSHASPGLEFSSDVVLGGPDRFLRARRAGGQVERLAGVGSGDVVYLGALDAITRTVVRAGGADHLTLETNKLGMFGAAPATRPAYTVSGLGTPLRTLNAGTSSTSDVRAVLAALISDLKSYGLLG
jgi:hypothetical protein